MPKFENKPYSKDDYDKNAEDAEGLKKQMVGAKTADEMMAIATKMKAAEGNEKELMGNAQEEAGKENEERKAYDEAVAEDTERNMYDEAKAEDAERATAKETEKMDADLENLKSQIVGAKNADEMMEIAGKIKKIEEKKKEIGSGSQKEESEKRGKELEELKLKDKTESAEKVEEILKKIQSSMGVENAEPNAEKTLIDKIGLPKTEMFEKHGEQMHRAADELITVAKEMKQNDEKLRKMQHDYAETKDSVEKGKIEKSYNELLSKNNALNERRNELKSDASWGSKVVKFRDQKYGNESYDEYSKYRSEQTNAYHKTAMDDPYVVLREVEAGQIGFGYEGLGSMKQEVSEKLRSNPEFIAKVLDIMSPRQAGGFWANVVGEANNRDLYIKAVKKNHLNYQWGANEWKSDPEIQKVALESGLYSRYLYKG